MRAGRNPSNITRWSRDADRSTGRVFHNYMEDGEAALALFEREQLGYLLSRYAPEDAIAPAAGGLANGQHHVQAEARP